MSALTWVFWVAGAASAFAWIASLVSGDTSWVDRLWSILPVVYLVIFAAYDDFRSARLDAMAALVVLWGVRLTYNFARKGGYSGVEDYRWRVLRDSMSPRQFQFFNLFFIVVYQNALLVMIALPAYSVERHRDTPFGVLDALLALTFLVLLLAESIADQQQWDYQQAKRRIVATGRTPEPGFLREGLFRYSRHPNYFFEIAQWWVVYAFAVVAARTALQWTLVGPVLLTVLFIGSTRFTERISAERYPLYARYQREVSAIVPWRPRPGASDVLVGTPPPESDVAAP